MTARIVGAALLAYLLGSVPTSYLIMRLVKGVDLRQTGSGNLGATNLFRSLGWKFAVPAALFDMAKGAIPVAVLGPWAGLGLAGRTALGLAAVVGHVFSVFMHFRGGKGVATGGGVVLGLVPGAFLVALALWALLVRLTGYVSVASIVAALSLPPATWLLATDRRELVPWFGALALLVVFLHRGNVVRLWRGTEHRFGHGRPPGAAA